ncbi:MAG: hypothetical protein Q4C83_00030 [Candidatus Saccharibacteria bacterium]|nr:hypothetical protein [Candidatus Saccharibacteria bacterium]
MQPNANGQPMMQPGQTVTSGQGTIGMPETVTPKNPNSTQNSLKFSELRDDMVIMGDGTFRAVVAAQSINFDLMSAREREGVEMSYQDFLNALTFPIQIYIKSERVDIGPYLNRLSQVRMRQDNMLLGVLMDDYINFINALSREANIMDKSFFVVIPYQIGEDKQKLGDSSSNKGIFAKIFSSDDNHMRIKIPADQYVKAKDEINNRVQSVVSGLMSCGVKSVRLKTKELGELYYNIYNPDTAIRQPIGDFRAFTSDVVHRGQGDAKFNPVGMMYGQ